MIAAAYVIAILAVSVAARWIYVHIEKSQRVAGTYAERFVMVSDDGTPRELSETEKAHLNGEYEFGDGDRPYIKASYRSLTPDGRMLGYLRRRRLPRGMHIRR